MSSVEGRGIRGFNVPVLFIMFNRPNHAKQVLECIRLVKPTDLFIAIDGPRSNYPDDVTNTHECLELIDEIDWPCKIRRLVRKNNLGCKLAVSAAIDWFFDSVEEGIILEDDCVPDTTFFGFCETLLRKYRDEPKIMHIGGANVYERQVWSQDTYFLSYIPHIWGWATWRRAWKHYDVKMQNYAQPSESNVVKNIVIDLTSRKYWKKIFDSTYSGKIDTWDYQWVYTIWKERGLCVIPNYNMIRNIGFDGTGTHTKFNSRVSSIPITPIDTNSIIHPNELIVNSDAVEYAFSELYRQPPWWRVRINQIRSKFNLN